MKKSLLLLSVICFGLAISGCAQQMSRYQKNLMFEADLYFEQGDYYYAAQLYEELIAENPDNPALQGRLGIAYFHLPPFKERSAGTLEKAVELGDTESLFFLAKVRHQSYQFYDALDLLGLYERRPERKQSVAAVSSAKAAANRANDFVKTPIPAQIVNLGEGVNSPMHDYAPVWDITNEMLYFTSRRRYDDKSEKDYSEQFDENIYAVNLKSHPLHAFPAPNSLNSRNNDASVACSQDGKQLIVYRTSKDGFSGNLYITRAEDYGWGKLEKLSDKINSKHQEASASFGGPDENVLYFSSDRPGGYGGKDLYRVQRMPDGSWSEASNLGPTINTEHDEDAPFVAADGTLYFASKGHDNMGGFDIFSALPGKDGFAKPTNMGYPINTPADDIFFSLDETGKHGYFSSDRQGGYGLQDLYSVHFDDTQTVIYRGQLVSTNNAFEGRATIRLIDGDRETQTMLFQTSNKQSDFVLALEAGKDYTVIIEADGYLPFKKTVNVAAGSGKKGEINEDILLSK